MGFFSCFHGTSFFANNSLIKHIKTARQVQGKSCVFRESRFPDIDVARTTDEQQRLLARRVKNPFLDST